MLSRFNREFARRAAHEGFLASLKMRRKLGLAAKSLPEWFFGSFPSMYAGLVTAKGRVKMYDGNLRSEKPLASLRRTRWNPMRTRSGLARPVCATRT